MPKGRTNSPLVVWVAPEFRDLDAVNRLVQQGHRVVDMQHVYEYGLAGSEGGEPDLILHPAAHNWNDKMWDYLPAALTAARKRKKEAKSGSSAV